MASISTLNGLNSFGASYVNGFSVVTLKTRNGSNIRNGLLMHLASNSGVTTSGTNVIEWNASSGPSSAVPLDANYPQLTSGLIVFDGVNDQLGHRVDLVSAVNMPDGSGGDTGEGFTCTGLAYDAVRDSLWAGNDGRNVEGDLTFEPSLIELSPDGKTKLSEIILSSLYPSMTSVQGVAVDTTDDTLWCASTAEAKIHHLTKSGVNIGNISTDANPNGLVYDAALDALVVMTNVGVVKRYSASTGSLLATLTTLTATAPDHIAIGSDGSLYATAGPNASDGAIWRLATGETTWRRIYSVAASDAIEGIYRNSQGFQLCNDGYFHPGDPLKNRLLTYTYPELVSESVLHFVIAYKLTSLPATTARQVFGFGQPVDLPGAAIFALTTATTTIRLIVNTAAGSTKRAVVDATVSATTNLSVIRIKIDLTAKLASVWQNESLITSSGNLSACDSSIRVDAVLVGNGTDLPGPRFCPCAIGDIWFGVGEDLSSAAANAASAMMTRHGL